MTWDELKKATLGKMFATEDGAADLTDGRNVDYVAMMPAAANEAMQYIAARVPLRRCAMIEMDYSDKPVYRWAKEVCPHYKSLGLNVEAYLMDGEGGMTTVDVTAMGGSFLQLPARREGKLLLYYDAWPQTFTGLTDGKTKVEMEPDLVCLLPLYMASQLMKEDDSRIATQYRNEFEAALDLILRPQGVQAAQFTDTAGWL